MGQVTGEEVKGYKKLKVYQSAHLLVKEVYKVTAKFPQSELFGLTSQMRRAAVSVVANILEGYGRYGSKELLRFLHIAQGSLAELEYYIELSGDLGYCTSPATHDLEEIRLATGALLGGWIRSLKSVKN